MLIHLLMFFLPHFWGRETRPIGGRTVKMAAILAGTNEGAPYAKEI